MKKMNKSSYPDIPRHFEIILISYRESNEKLSYQQLLQKIIERYEFE